MQCKIQAVLWLPCSCNGHGASLKPRPSLLEAPTFCIANEKTAVKTQEFHNKMIAIAAVLSIAICSPLAVASGSAGGAGGVSKFGQMYTQGKSVFFKKIACDNDCPLSRKDINKEKAKQIVTAIQSRDALEKSESELDEIVSLLNDSEIERVEHYLVRRFNIKDG